MIPALRFIVVIAMVLAANIAGTCAARADTTLVSIQTPRGAKQSFILIKPDKPVASVILFAGGHGALGLKSASDMTWGKGNFLVRTRDQFAARNLMVAVIDAPSDQQGGMNAIFRMSKAHADDIDAVAGLSEKAGGRAGLGGRHQHGHILGGARRHRHQGCRWPGADLQHHPQPGRTGKSPAAIRTPSPACRCRRSPYRRW